MIEATTSSTISGLNDPATDTSPNSGAGALGMESFLELMTTQMRFQDPTAPADSSQFLEQMAQFSTVSGIQSMEQSLVSAVESLQSSQLLQASSLVGKQVLINTDEIVADSPVNAISGEVGLFSHTASLKVQIIDESGQTVRSLELGDQTAGQVGFSWDGLDINGNAVPAGTYQITASVPEESEIEPEMFIRAPVNSVSIGFGGDLNLQINQLAPVPLNEVVEVS